MRRFLDSIASPIEWAIIAFALVQVLRMEPVHGADLVLVAGEITTDVQRLTGKPIEAAIGVVQVPAAQIREFCQCRGARALFRDGVVMIDEAIDLGTMEGRAILAHEFTHAMQWAQHGNAGDCMEWLAREAEAINVERRWRLEHGASLPPIPVYTCREK